MTGNGRILGIALGTIALSTALCGCGAGSGGDGTGSEVATAAMGGVSTASEGTVASTSNLRPRSSYLARVRSELLPMRSAWAVPACDFATLITACSSNSETVTFNGCSVPTDPAIQITGSESFAWTGTGCCTATPLSASSSTPCSFTRRTVSSSGAADPMVRAVGSNAITLDTEDSSGYSQSKTGGFSILCQGSGGTATCDGQRQITIAGAHYTGQSGRAQWDHTVSTDQPLIEQGHDSTRKILSGVIRVQHNLTKMISISTVTSTLTFASNCCYPTGGSISTTYSGGSLDGKTETLTYGPTCGQSTLNSTANQQTGLTLHHCL